MKYLIINADDFGLTVGVNDAIIDAFLCHCVTSATLIVNASATEDAACKAREYPSLAVGLHFNVTLGRPLSDPGKVRSLVDQTGHFYSRGVLARRLLCRRVETRELELELSAQVERMAELGLQLSHIDSHQHIHGFPIVFNTLAARCTALGIAMRVPWVAAHKNVVAVPSRRVRRWVLRKMLHTNVNRWAGRLRCNSALGSIFDLGEVPQVLTADHYRKLLETHCAGFYELMVHPARDQRELVGLTRIGEVSQKEWTFLTSGELTPLVAELGFTMGNYRNIP